MRRNKPTPMTLGDFIPKSIGTLITDKMRLTLADTLYGTYSTAGSSSLRQLCSGNSIYDPDATGVGGQPTGFDQWFAFYQHVVVLGCKITVEFVNNASDPVSMCIYPIRSAVTSATPEEQKHAKWVTMVPTYRSYKLTHNARTQDVLGHPIIFDRESYAHSNSANPTDRWYWLLNWHNLAGNSSISSVGQIKLEYDCVFFERLGMIDS